MQRTTRNPPQKRRKKEDDDTFGVNTGICLPSMVFPVIDEEPFHGKATVDPLLLVKIPAFPSGVERKTSRFMVDSSDEFKLPRLPLSLVYSPEISAA